MKDEPQDPVEAARRKKGEAAGTRESQPGKEEDATETSGSDQENKEDAVTPEDVAMKTNTVKDTESKSGYFINLWNLTRLAASLDNGKYWQVSGNTGKCVDHTGK